MATFHWASDSGGDWSTAANWLNQNGTPGVPGPDDDAVVSVAGITVTTSGSISVNSLTLASGSTLDVTSGSFTVANSNGSSTQLGTLDLASGTTFQVQAGTAELTSGGTIAGDLSIATGATLENAGTTALSAGGNIAGPGTFDNLSGGAVNFNSSANLFLAASGTLTNAGTMTVDAGTGTVAEYATTFDNTGTLSVDSGSFAIIYAGQSTGTFDVAAAATFQFSGDVYTSAPYVLASGAVLSGAGQYQVNAEFCLLDVETDISVADLSLSAGTIEGTGGVTVTNAFDWTGGDFSGSGTLSIPSTATLSIDSPTTIVLTGWTIDNSGSATFASGTTLNGPGTFNNMSGATLTLDGNTTFLNSGPGTLNNAGTIVVSAGTGITTMRATTFNNTGSVTVVSGALALLSSGTSSGTFEVAAGAFFEFSGDITTNTPFVLASGAVLSGKGQYQVNAEFMYLEIDTDVSVVSFNLSSGTIQGTGGVTVANDFDWTGGSFSGSGTLSIPSTATLSIDSATTVVLTGWTIDNSGSANVASGTVSNGSGTFNNMSSGLLTLEGNTTILNAGPGTLNNAGTLAISAGTGTTTINAAPFNNTGSVTVVSGTLLILSDGTSSGPFDVAAGAGLQFGGDLSANTPYILAPGAVLSGAGQYQVNAEFMFLEIDTSISVASFVVSAGAITGTGSLTVTGALNWSGGAFYGTWALTIDQAATLSIDPTSFDEFGIMMDNAGTVTWSSGAFNFLDRTYAGEFNNYGTFDIGDVAANDENAGQMNNYGTLAKTAGSGTTLFGSPLFNAGTVEVDSGTLDFVSNVSNPIAQLTGTTLTGGTWNVAGGAALDFPSGSNITTNQASITLEGPGASFSALAGLATNSGSLTLTGGATFTTAGPLANDGAIAVGPSSVLSVTGAYSQSAGATLGVTLGGPSASGQFGQVKSTGPATLDGTLDLSLSAGFTPTAGDTYSILTYPSATGAFAAIDRLSSGAGQYLNVSAKLTSVTVASSASASDLADGSISVPTVAETPGQPISISFQVNNLSATATPQNLTSWTDSVYLSLSSTFDDTAILLGRVTHQGTLAGNSSYTDTVTDPLPGLAPGSYHVFAVADSQELLPDPNRANNTGVASTLLTVGYPTLSLGQQATGTISSGQNAYYEVTLPAGSATRIMAGSTVAGGVSLYVGYLSVPTSSTFDQSSAAPTSLAQSVLLPGTQAGAYYILVQGSSALTTAQPFTLEAQSLPLEVVSVSTASGANVGTTTLTVSGSMFTAGTTLKLIPQGGGPPIAASSVTQEDTSTLFASFNLAGASAGRYNLEAIDGSQTATEPGAFTVTAGSPGQLSVTMSEPSAIRVGRTGTVIVDYSNIGGSDIPAPLLVLTAQNASLELPGSVIPAGATLDFLGINPSGPAGVLPPGASGTVVIDFTPTSLMSSENSGGLIQFNLAEVPEDSTPMDWASQESALQPSNIPASAWGAVFTNFVASVGSTTGQYVAALDADATYLSQLGESTDDVSRLLGFEILKADAFYTTATLATVTDASYPTPGAIPLELVRQFNASIGGRDQSGPLGDGWTDNWQISAATDAQRNVTITDDGSTAYFTLQPNGSYMAMPGDYDTLTLVAGAYQLRQTDGTLVVFNPSGSLAYMQDRNGNRVTATYDSSGQLTLLTASSGSALTISYNSQGLISKVTDPAGQTTTYSYDASGTHLIAYTDTYGTTDYTYLSGPTAADANALASIAYPDNTHIYYTFDAQGRLSGQSRDGGAMALTYTYGAVGGYTVTNADGDATTILADDMGAIAETIDPLGNITRYTYDADQNLTSVVAPDGTTTTFTYLCSGQPQLAEFFQIFGRRVAPFADRTRLKAA